MNPFRAKKLLKQEYSLLKVIWRNNKGAISFVYLLNIIEEICYLLIPSAVGLLIDTFIEGKGWGILAFTTTYLGWQGANTYRKIKDTIVFTELFNQNSLKVIEDHQRKDISTTKINARIELLKEVVEFFERDLPMIFNSVISIIGAAILLFFYNPKLLIISLLIIFPSIVFNYFYSKRILLVTQKINNQYEQQIEVIESRDEAQQKIYFEELRRLNIKRSTLEAINFGVIEIFVFGMILTSIYIICHTDGMNYGSIVASYGIILRFAYGFDFIPYSTTRLATMKDVVQRLDETFKQVKEGKDS
ncbi:MAG TPA: hypothetical protein DCS93_11315 [Microscillaceae bacterium]|nr:hypothetical protein [Microscillaceae bacterium]